MTDSGRPMPHPGHVAAAHGASTGVPGAHSGAAGTGFESARELVGQVREALDVPIPDAPTSDDTSDYSGTALDELAHAAGRLERAHELLSDALAAVDKT